MTALALRAVLAEMPVILVMATAACLDEVFAVPGGCAMAGGALQFGVAAEQREMRLPRMIEAP